MNKKQIKLMILELLECIDYDIYKDFIPETSEDPDGIDERLNELINIVNKHLKKKGFDESFEREVGSPEDIKKALESSLKFLNKIRSINRIFTFEDLERAIQEGLSKKEILSSMDIGWKEDWRFNFSELEKRNKLFKRAGIRKEEIHW